MKTIQLDFDGYWNEDYLSSIPDYLGIYIVYAMEYNKPRTTILPPRIIDIGSSKNIRLDCSNLNKLSNWKKELKCGEELFFSATPVEHNLIDRLKNALIAANKPVLNTVAEEEKFNLSLLIICKGKALGMKEYILD